MKNGDLHRDFEGLLSRFLSGELTPGEEALFREQLRSDPGKKELLESYRRIWDGAAPEQSYDLDAEWDLLRNRIPGFETESGRGNARPIGRSLRHYTYRIAAVLVLGMVLTFSWIYVNRLSGTLRVVAEDQPVQLMLHDGTRVTVNKNSRLRCSKAFGPGERRVYLSGEAWFDVARDTARPFVVDAGTALVKVLGTTFNVNAYRDNPTVEITVESGLVALSGKADLTDQIVMKAGAGGSYDKSRKELKLIPSSDPNSIAWKTRELYFNGTSLREACTLINKLYGVRLVIVNNELASCPITVTFRDQSLESVLMVLESTLDLELSRNGDEIRLDGKGCAE